MIGWKTLTTYLACAAWLVAASLSAYDGCWDCFDDDCCRGPLYPCSMRIGINGGTSYSILTDEGLGVDIGPGGVTGLRPMADFDQMWHFPYQGSGFVGLAISDSTEVFIEGEYLHANGAQFAYRWPHPIVTHMGDLERYALFVGVREYLGMLETCYCDFAPFIGLKGGAVYYEEVKFDEFVETMNVENLNRTYFKGNYAPVVGGQVGVQIEFCPCIHLMTTLEVIYAGEMRSNSWVLDGSGATIDAISLGDTGPILSFPLTIGLAIGL